MTWFTSNMVKTFVGFHPLGVVLVAMLGIGVADHTGFIRAGLKALLNVTSPKILTPMLLLIAIVSHSGGDAGYVLVIPLGAVIFQAAGRHPLAGIACAFAGVSGGFSANFVPSMIDPLLQGISQAAAQIIDPELTLNPLNNWFFTSASCLLVVGVGWYLTDKVIEPRLAATEVDGDLADAPALESLTDVERKGLYMALLSMIVTAVILVVTSLPDDSSWRAASGGLAAAGSPLMASIVTLIFIFFLIPGIVYGYVAGTVNSHHDIVAGMSESMRGMSYYLVMAFFASLFISELFIGSASAKWALLAPILIPMLMQLGISPDITQAAYRIGDSSTNIITPLMPYFPLVVVFSQRYVKNTGIGTVVAMMLPYSLSFLLVWTLFLLGYWYIGFPLGLQSSYVYPAL
jgi:aminobenzoyl-glutamate transport protein